ncbi:hypothetical protein J7L05_08835 [bacterium]|nr:hypothetical protein [bacterium]
MAKRPRPYIIVDEANNILEIYLSYVLQSEDSWHFAECPELQIADQGKTQREAIENLQKMVVEVLLEAIQTGNLNRMLSDLGFRKSTIHQRKQFSSTFGDYEEMHPMSINVPIPPEVQMASTA